MSLFAVLAVKMCLFLAFERNWETEYAPIDEETVSEEYISV